MGRMSSPSRGRFRGVLALAWLLSMARASALILFGTDDPQRNTAPPVALANSVGESST